MAQKKNTAIYIVSGVLIATAAFFVIRGIYFSREAKRRKAQLQAQGEQGGVTAIDPIVQPALSAAEQGSRVVGSAISGVVGLNPATLLNTPSVVYSKSLTNLRPEPSTAKKQIKQYPKAGVELRVLGVQQSGIFTWYNVTDGSARGWVRSDAVSLTK